MLGSRRGILVGLLLSMAIISPGASQERVTVAVSVDVRGEGNQFLVSGRGYEIARLLTDGLQGLGSVQVGQPHEMEYPDVRVQVLGLSLDGNNFALTTGVFIRCPGDFEQFAPLYEQMQNDSSRTQYLKLMQQIGVLRGMCYGEVFRDIQTWNRETVIANEVASLMAQIKVRAIDVVRSFKR